MAMRRHDRFAAAADVALEPNGFIGASDFRVPEYFPDCTAFALQSTLKGSTVPMRSLVA